MWRGHFHEEVLRKFWLDTFAPLGHRTGAEWHQPTRFKRKHPSRAGSRETDMPTMRCILSGFQQQHIQEVNLLWIINQENSSAYY